MADSGTVIDQINIIVEMLVEFCVFCQNGIDSIL